MLLTDEERVKFARYLEQDIASERLLIEQMEKLTVPPALIQKRKNEVIAMQIVAHMLRNTQSETFR